MPGSSRDRRCRSTAASTCIDGTTERSEAARRDDDIRTAGRAASTTDFTAFTPVTASPNYAPPKKRSVLIAGHQSSISLEPMFWRALEAAAKERGCPVNALVAEIDASRLHAERPPNLTSAIRQWLFER